MISRPFSTIFQRAGRYAAHCQTQGIPPAQPQRRAIFVRQMLPTAGNSRASTGRSFHKITTRPIQTGC